MPNLVKQIIIAGVPMAAMFLLATPVFGQTFTQQDYRWYENINDITPTSSFAATNTAPTLTSTSSPLRLRTNVTVSENSLATSSQAFKLQFSQATTSGWVDVGTWWDTSWRNRRKITFSNASSSEALVNFPALVLLNATNSNNIDYSKTQNSGQDIRFTDSDGVTPLNYEIDRWDESATSSVWVKVSSIATGSADFIYMYYNNASASGNSTTTGVWDSNFKLVTHFGSADASATDSTANVNHGTVTGATATTSAMIAYAKNFDGIDDLISVGDSASLQDVDGPLTVSMWINARSEGEVNSGRITQKNSLDFSIHPDRINGIRFLYDFDGGTNLNRGTTDNAISLNTWRHVSLTWDGSNFSSNVHIYIDGIEASYQGGTDGVGNKVSHAGTDLIIGNFTIDGIRAFDGIIDSVRLSNSVRSSSWLTAEYKNGTNAFNSFGGEEGVASTTWLFFDNNAVADGAVIATTTLATSEVGESYEESNPTAANPKRIDAGQEGEWDFALNPFNATNTTYYFRMIKDNDATLDTYTNFPSLAVNITANLTQIHYRWRNDDGNEVGATFAAAEDTQLSNLAKRSLIRLRLEVSNEGTATSSGEQYRLEYGTLISSCSAISTWIPLVNTGSASDQHWSLVNTSNVSDGTVTTDNAGITNENATFVAGQFRSVTNLTSAITLGTTQFSELEWALWAEQAATNGGTYCFRVTNNGLTTNFSFSVYPQSSIRAGGGAGGATSEGGAPATTATTGGTTQGGGSSSEGGAGGGGSTGGGTGQSGGGGSP